MAQNNYQETRIITKIAPGVAIAASLMLATSTVAMFFAWGMMAILNISQILNSKVTMAVEAVNPITVELRVPDYVRDYQILSHPSAFLPGQRIRIRGSIPDIKSYESISAKIIGRNTIVQKDLNVVQAKEKNIDLLIPQNVTTDTYDLILSVDDIVYKTSLSITNIAPAVTGGGGSLGEEVPVSSAILYTSNIDCIDRDPNHSQGVSCAWESAIAGHPTNPDMLIYAYTSFRGIKRSPFYYTQSGGRDLGDGEKPWKSFNYDESYNLGEFCCDPKAIMTPEGKSYTLGISGAFGDGLFFQGDMGDINNILKKTLIKKTSSIRQSVDRPVLAYDSLSKAIYIAAHAVYFEEDIYGPGLFISRDYGQSFTLFQLDPTGALLRGMPEVTSLDVTPDGLLRGLTADYADKTTGQAKIKLLRFNKEADSFVIQPAIKLEHWFSWPGWVGPEIAIDNGSESAHKGRMYILWSQPEDVFIPDGGSYPLGKNYDIFLSYSDNDGQTWSQPVKVNNDKSDFEDNKFPSIKIDSGGMIHIAYLRYDNNVKQGNIFYALFKDGLVSENIRVNKIPLDTWDIGDYSDMLVSYPTKAYVAHPCPVASTYRGAPVTLWDECVAAIDPNLVAFPPALKFLRGDVNHDNKVDISDPVYILTYLFQGGEQPKCEDSADANDDGMVDISDPIKILSYLFTNDQTGEIPLPGAISAGLDPTVDDLGCGV